MKKIVVEGRELDKQQVGCITEVHHNHLVVAGAGTGKTTTIIGKIKYLLETGYCKAEEILVLSFTNASAMEMKERIEKEVSGVLDGGVGAGAGAGAGARVRNEVAKKNTETRTRKGEAGGKGVTASTFHKLGLEILKKINPGVAKITKHSLAEYIDKTLSEAEKPLAETYEQIVSNARTNNIDLSKLERKHLRQEDIDILERAMGINDGYTKLLRSKGEIDFAEMINLATAAVREGKYKNPYKFVIVDEYQDISMPRYELLKALRESSDYDLFCVGDDWQAIYRFAGSEIDLILNFEKYWGEAKLSKIETTYRFPNSIAHASGKFVMENIAQIPKKIKALPDGEAVMRDEFGEPMKKKDGTLRRKKEYAVTEICADAVMEGMEYVNKILADLPMSATVYFIGRYTFDAAVLRVAPGFKMKGEKVEFMGRPDLDIRFLTAHKSKGLQADYVFAMNLKNATMGFPSKVVSTPIVEMLHSKKEKFPYAEERRLFYVTMTRAKKHLYLLTVHKHKSVFVRELEDLLYRKMNVVDLGLLEG